MSCCGRNCEECIYHPHECLGCEEERGRIFWIEYLDEIICPIFNCCRGKYGYPDCGVCSKWPCERYEDNYAKDSNSPAAATGIIAREKLLKKSGAEVLAAEMGLDIKTAELLNDLNSKTKTEHLESAELDPNPNSTQEITDFEDCAFNSDGEISDAVYYKT